MCTIHLQKGLTEWRPECVTLYTDVPVFSKCTMHAEETGSLNKG